MYELVSQFTHSTRLTVHPLYSSHSSLTPLVSQFTHWGLFRLVHEVSEVVVLVLLEGSEEKVQDFLTISPRTLPLLLLLLLMLHL